MEARTYPSLSARAWTLTTVLVAGVGWALASAPAPFRIPGGGNAPHPLLVMTMAAALGLVMGAVMGTAQALVLRRRVRHPWRWVGISAAGWTPAMVIIFVGVTVPDPSWPTAAVIVRAAVTGAIAPTCSSGCARLAFDDVDERLTDDQHSVALACDRA